VTLDENNRNIASSLTKNALRVIAYEYIGRFAVSVTDAIGLVTGDIRMSTSSSDDDHVLTKRGERRVFIFIAVILFPVLSIIIVGGYGFSIWMLQLIFGPPGTS